MDDYFYVVHHRGAPPTTGVAVFQTAEEAQSYVTSKNASLPEDTFSYYYYESVKFTPES